VVIPNLANDKSYYYEKAAFCCKLPATRRHKSIKFKFIKLNLHSSSRRRDQLSNVTEQQIDGSDATDCMRVAAAATQHVLQVAAMQKLCNWKIP